MKVALLALLAATAAALTAAPAAAQEEPGVIRAMAFHDLDGNGVQDEGDPGIFATINLSQGDEFIRGLGSGLFGFSRFDGLTPGEYTVAFGLDQPAPGGCVDGAEFFFDPFPSGYCVNSLVLPWRATTPDSVAVTVESGMTVEVAFGVQPLDVAVITGTALLEDGVAPEGTLIEALVNGQECGSTTTAENLGLHFDLTILGAGERPGCGTTGDLVHFRVGGVAATETFTWIPFIDKPQMFTWHLQHLSAMEERAWYWLEGPSDDLPAVDSTVQAVVDGVVCDETVVEAATFFGTAGFPRLIVLSETLQPGCARPGATVAFLVDGVEVATIPWQAGLQRLELAAPVPVQGPVAGSGPQPHGRSVATALIAALFATGLLLAGGSRLLAHRR